LVEGVLVEHVAALEQRRERELEPLEGGLGREVQRVGCEPVPAGLVEREQLGERAQLAFVLGLLLARGRSGGQPGSPSGPARIINACSRNRSQSTPASFTWPKQSSCGTADARTTGRPSSIAADAWRASCAAVESAAGGRTCSTFFPTSTSRLSRCATSEEAPYSQLCAGAVAALVADAG
jgi:hypothetical protein